MLTWPDDHFDWWIRVCVGTYALPSVCLAIKVVNILCFTQSISSYLQQPQYGAFLLEPGFEPLLDSFRPGLDTCMVYFLAQLQPVFIFLLCCLFCLISLMSLQGWCCSSLTVDRERVLRPINHRLLFDGSKYNFQLSFWASLFHAGSNCRVSVFSFSSPPAFLDWICRVSSTRAYCFHCSLLQPFRLIMQSLWSQVTSRDVVYEKVWCELWILTLVLEFYTGLTVSIEIWLMIISIWFLFNGSEYIA
jgi:hypothetical protein